MTPLNEFSRSFRGEEDASITARFTPVCAANPESLTLIITDFTRAPIGVVLTRVEAIRFVTFLRVLFSKSLARGSTNDRFTLSGAGIEMEAHYDNAASPYREGVRVCLSNSAPGETSVFLDHEDFGQFLAFLESGFSSAG